MRESCTTISASGFLWFQLQLGMSGNQLPADAVASRVELDHSVAELDALISDVHNLSHRLHSSKLEHLGLKAAMKDLCRRWRNDTDCRSTSGTDCTGWSLRQCSTFLPRRAGGPEQRRQAQRCNQSASEPDSGTGSATNAGAGLGTRIQDWGGSCRTWIYSDARASSQHWGEIVHRVKTRRRNGGDRGGAGPDQQWIQCRSFRHRIAGIIQSRE